MSSIRYLGISLVALIFLAGCQSTPTVTRSGDVKDIIIGDNLSSGEVVVSPGDEVRWVNKGPRLCELSFSTLCRTSSCPARIISVG